MKKILLLAVVLAGVSFGGIQALIEPVRSAVTIERTESADQTLAAAFRNRQGDLQVQGSGTVLKVLADDNKGSRHQRFILRLDSGQTVLVAHNIDLAPRVVGLETGDRVEFYGEYEWNPQGGVIHWTHDDPAGRHVAGWLKHDGQLYH
ncbi:MAG: DUF3465 domain-containing protein [Azoarcus sp.]|jgi:hypothetical protein|nr:DUF3465 domain-containing protein [Azoarcus sp.]MDX9837917.1 DUF3465 domain-containing protein [Azoarcus sp.]